MLALIPISTSYRIFKPAVIERFGEDLIDGAINRIGLCSESKNDERINLVKNRPKAPISLVWIFLAEAEFYAGLGEAIYTKLLARKDTDCYIGLRAIKASLVLRRTMFARQFSSLPLLIEEIAIAATIAKERAEKEFFSYHPQPEIPKGINDAMNTFAVDPFCGALMRSIVDDEDWQINVVAWRDSAKKTVTGYDFKPFLDRIEKVMKFGQHDAGEVYKSSQTRLDRILSSIRLATSIDSSLSACFVGCVSLVTDEAFILGLNGERTVLGEMVRGLWLKRLKFRAEFNLSRFSVPAVEAACNSPHTGLKLAACILLAAESAVSTRVPQNTHAILQKLAAG